MEKNKITLNTLEFSERIQYRGNEREKEKINLFLFNNPHLVSEWDADNSTVLILKKKENIISENLLKLVKTELLNNDEMTYFNISNSFCNIYTNKKYLGVEGLAFSNKENSDQLAFIEYLERLCSFGDNTIFIKKFDDKKMIPLDKVNHFWLGKKVQIKKKYLYVTKGKSIYSNEKKFIPSELVYYNVRTKNNQLFEGSSNGCAVGANFDDALLRAILEFVERDSFMKFWFSNNPKNFAKRINFEKNNKLKLKEKILFNMGYELDFFKINSVPSLNTVWCLARSINDHNKIYSMSGLSCDNNLYEAINKSFEEMFVVLKLRSKEKDIHRKIKRTEEEFKNNKLLDNILYYFSSYERKKEFNSLINEIGVIDLKQFSNNEDKKNDLGIIIKDLESIYSDIIVVDQTSEYLKKLKLKCVKVIVVEGWDIYFKQRKNIFGFHYQPIA